MARLPYPDRATMPTTVANLLVQFPRQAITEMYAHAASLTEPFLRMAQAQFTSTELTMRQRELIILTIAGQIDCEYEYAQHQPIAEAAGITADTRERIRNGDFTGVTDPAEHALITFAAAVVHGPRVSDETFDAARARLNPRQILETLQLVSFYWGIGRICTVLDLEIDHPDGLAPVTGVSNLTPRDRHTDDRPGVTVTLSDEQVLSLFEATDRGDIETVCSYFDNAIEVSFGNHDPVRGTESYAALYRQFSSNFRGIRHDIHNIWRAQDRLGVVIATMTVHYTRHDGRVTSVPCCNVLHVIDGRIRRYQVYLDVAPALAEGG